MKKAVILGAGGFIGSHLISFLKQKNYWIRGIDLKENQFLESKADEFTIGDLRDPSFVKNVLDGSIDEVYQLAADMGGAGYISPGINDAKIMLNSSLININVIKALESQKGIKLFYASSACVYPQSQQTCLDAINFREDTVYPADPDSEYGWEKLYSERLFLAAQKNYGLNLRIARFHNIYGPYTAWNNGLEKAPGAICRKVAEAENEEAIEIWGDGTQLRSFLYIDDALEAVHRLMGSSYDKPINIGSEDIITITQLAEYIIDISKKNLSIKYVPGPIGVHCRNSNNEKIRKELSFDPVYSFKEGMTRTYRWIEGEVKKSLMEVVQR